MKICAVGAELFHSDGQRHIQTDGRTDMTKLVVAFRNFANAPNNADPTSQKNTKRPRYKGKPVKVG
jgi:hypothetical protein